MDGRLASGSMMPGSASYGGFDLQGSMRLHSQHPFPIQSQPQPGPMVPIHNNFPLTIGSIHEANRNVALVEKNRNVSDEEAEDTADDGPSKGKKAFPWHRVKWTDAMVRMLITAVSYIGEEITADYVSGGRKKCTNSQKRGKWKSISKVMAERGHLVSPQQCEDKFNDLNKRYKRLNEILGRGTSCLVVEKPERLDKMGISEKAKEEVRKILSSKHLHYEEMCSYHNNNRLHLPHDPELQRSLHFALRNRDDVDENSLKRSSQDENDEDDQDVELYDHDGSEENHGCQRMVHGISEGGPSKRLKPSQGNEITLDCNRSLNIGSPSALADENQVIPEGVKSDAMSKQWIAQHSLQLEERKLHIQAQQLELEKERFKWQKFSRKKDRELEMMKAENERLKLENQHMELELRRKEMGMENS